MPNISSLRSTLSSFRYSIYPNSVRAKLLFNFAGITVFTVIIIALSIFILARSWSVLNNISESLLPKSTLALQISNQSKTVIAAVPDILAAKAQGQRKSASNVMTDEFNYLSELILQLQQSDIDLNRRLPDVEALVRDVAILKSSLERLELLVEIRIDLKYMREKELLGLNKIQRQILSGWRDQTVNPSSQRIQNYSLSNMVNFIRTGATAERNVQVRKIRKEFTEFLNSLSVDESNALNAISVIGLRQNNVFISRIQENDISLKIGRLERVYRHDANRLSFSANALSREAQLDIVAVSQAYRKNTFIQGLILLIIGIICVVGATILALKISRNIASRLSVLTRSMEVHAAGGICEIPFGGSDEIAEMADSLRTFIDKIDQREIALKRELIHRETTQRLLETSEKRFKDFAESSADWFWETNAEFHFTYVTGKNLSNFGIQTITKPSTHSPIHFSSWFSDEEQWNEHHQLLKIHAPFDNYRIERSKVDGEIGYMSLTAKPIFDSKARFLGYRGTGRDVTESHTLSEELRYQASHDALTGLVNRRKFEQKLSQAIEDSIETGTEHALCYLDLDQFKVINDTCGHIAGDELLRQLCEVMKPKVRRHDTLARLGGDEFGVLLSHCSILEAAKIADSLRRVISEFRFQWELQTFKVGVSIGLVPINRESRDSTSALRHADSACYAAKEGGRNRVHLYQKADKDLVAARSQIKWVVQIPKAMDEGRIKLFFQRIIPIQNNKSAGDHYEILIRIIDKNGDIVLPGTFLPAAERYDLMDMLDRWVVTNSLKWLAEHPVELKNLDLCSINLSGQSLANEEFLEFVVVQFKTGGVEPSKICFEVTETAAISKIINAKKFISRLGELGCKFSLDDFGSGFSSFAYLKNLDVDFIKIDGLFVKDIANDLIDLAMVKSINDIAHVLGKKTIAEFVESNEILEILREIGVDYAQGFGVHVPELLDNAASIPVASASEM